MLINLKKTIPQQLFIIFFISLLVYMICGLSFIVSQNYGDIIFKIDSYYFMYKCASFSAKLYKHPLINIILIPWIKLFTLFITSMNINAIFCQALSGSVANTLFFLIMNKLNFNNFYKIIFLGIFMLSFSNIIFSSMTELYIYTGLVQVLFLYSVILITENPDYKLKFSHIFLLALLTALSFGLNIWNIVSSLILIFYTVIKCNKTVIKIVRDILLIIIISIISITSLSFLQHKIYRCNNPFYDAIHYSLVYKDIHPIQKKGLSFDKKYSNIERIQCSVNGTLVRPFYAPGVAIQNKPVRGKSYFYKINKEQLKHDINFINGYVFRGENNRLYRKIINFPENQSFPENLPMLLFIVIPVFYILKNRRIYHSVLCLTLFCIFIINLISYCYFGFTEAFLYSQNHMCFTVLMFALLYKNIPSKSGRIFLTLFFLHQTICNITAISTMKFYIIQNFPHYANLYDKIIYVLVGILAFMIIISVIMSYKYNKRIAENNK